MAFSDGFTTLVTTPSAEILLTPGTDTNPQENFVYVTKANKYLEASTSDWPVNEEHIKVASVVLQSVSATSTEGALKNQNWNDHIQSTTTNQGHMSHITEAIRSKIGASWWSGCEGSCTVVATAPDDVYVAATGGIIYQLHRQAFPALNTQTGDDVHIINHATTPYLSVTNLNGQTSDALGNSLANSSFSFVMWGVANKTGQPSHIMINLPTDSYPKNAPDLAVEDAFNYSVYDIPSEFQGCGFLIARFTYVLEAGGTTWTLYDTEDLRGKSPNTTAGGGAGGTGVTTFLGLTDTPSSYAGEAGKIPNIASGETALEFVNPNVKPLRTETNDYTIVATDHTVFADATSNTVTISLPASPTQGQIFNIKCIDATFTCTVGRNGNNIDGAASDVTLALNAAASLQYDSTYGWGII